jgi:hypothetical protein
VFAWTEISIDAPLLLELAVKRRTDAFEPYGKRVESSVSSVSQST